MIGRSFSVLVQNIAPVALLALLMLSLPYVLGYFLGIRYSGGPFSEIETAAWTWREALAMTLQYFLANCLGAVLAVGVYETLQGHRPGAWALIRRGLVRFPGILAVVVVVTVPQVLLGVVAAVRAEEPWPMPWLSSLGPSVAFPALIAGLALTFLAWIYLFVAIPAAAVEGLGVMRSIEQSIELVRRSILRIIGLLLTVWVMTLAAFVAPGLLLEWAGIEVTAAHFPILVWPDLLLSAFEVALLGHRGWRWPTTIFAYPGRVAAWHGWRPASTEPLRGGGNGLTPGLPAFPPPLFAEAPLLPAQVEILDVAALPKPFDGTVHHDAPESPSRSPSTRRPARPWRSAPPAAWRHRAPG